MLRKNKFYAVSRMCRTYKSKEKPPCFYIKIRLIKIHRFVSDKSMYCSRYYFLTTFFVDGLIKDSIDGYNNRRRSVNSNFT